MLRLETFGGLTLTNGGNALPQPRRRLALLARLAVGGTRGVSRDEVLALFWPERNVESGRHSLDQLLYEARRALGAAPQRGTATLSLDTAVIASDFAEWSSALGREELETAAALHRGPFLQGFYLTGLPEFERWVEATRAELAADYRRVLQTLATRAGADGRLGDAVLWWRRLASEDRLGERTALALMHALVDAGDRAGALEFARVHERIVRAELETTPDPAVAAFVVALRRDTTQHAVLQLPTLAAEPPRPSPPHGAAAGVGLSEVQPATSTDAAARRRPRTPRRVAIGVVGAASLALGAVYVATSARRPTAMQLSRTANAAPPSRPSASPRHARSMRHGTSNIAAYELYVRGRDPRLLRSDSGLRAAIDYLRHAVTLDPNYAAAYAVLSSRYATVTWSAPLKADERRAMLERALMAARRAVELDDSLADAHVSLGYALAVGNDEPSSLAEFERAAALDPTSSETQEMLAKAYEWMDQPADAVAAAQRAVSADPLSATATAELGDALYFAHRYDEALAHLSRVATLEPPLRRVPGYLAAVYGAMGRWADAVAVLRPVAREQPLRGLLGYALARAGHREEAMSMLTQMLRNESVGLAQATAIAEVYAGLGDRERAFVWLERSLDDYSISGAHSEIMGPLFDDLHADPRFQRIRERLGLASGKGSARTDARR